MLHKSKDDAADFKLKLTKKIFLFYLNEIRSGKIKFVSFLSTHLSLRQLLLVDLLDLWAVRQQVAQFHITLPQLLVPAIRKQFLLKSSFMFILPYFQHNWTPLKNWCWAPKFESIVSVLSFKRIKRKCLNRSFQASFLYKMSLSLLWFACERRMGVIGKVTWTPPSLHPLSLLNLSPDWCTEGPTAAVLLPFTRLSPRSAAIIHLWLLRTESTAKTESYRVILPCFWCNYLSQLGMRKN